MNKEQLTTEDITLVVRLAYEKLTFADVKEVFGESRAMKWMSELGGDFVALWYYATAIQQENLLEIMNGYIDNQPIHTSRGEQL